MTNTIDYEKVENMRLLRRNEEYVLDDKLGFISLNSRLQENQVLMVAYEYMINGQIHQVGEFTQDKPADQNPLLFLKLLKPGSIRPLYDGVSYPAWDLMMKNIYNIGGYGLKPENFKLQLFYQSPTSLGEQAFLTLKNAEQRQLLNLTGMDQLTNNATNQPDNVFDFLQGITINADKGTIIFPKVEPFGGNLVNQFKIIEANPLSAQEDSSKFAFPQLYRKTKMDAITLHQDVNRYVMKGSFQGTSSSEISLNAINIAKGSVKVTANGIQLQDGTDFQVDYEIGKVTILNQGLLTSGQQIKVLFETNTLFGIENKTLVGSRFDLRVDKDIEVGATMLQLSERPMTQKIIIGEEPLRNTMLGFDAAIKKESKYLSRLVDKLPFLQTKEPSSLTALIEGATLLPGHPNSIAIKDEDGNILEKGVAYLDDFESAKSPYDLKGFRGWYLASFPGNNTNNNLYDPTILSDPLSSGYTRAKMSWYSIDQNFFYANPDDIFPKADLSSHYTRQINPKEVFKNRDFVIGDNLLTTMDLNYRPSVRGHYNYQNNSIKLNTNGTFSNPAENWAGIMKKTTSSTDFEASNYEFLEFFVLDPFIDDQTNGGEFYLNLGKLSEDVLPDGRRSFENGLPETGDYSTIDTTKWAFVPVFPVPVNAFSNDGDSRQYQDVGLDGLPDEKEREFHQTFLTNMETVLGIGTPALNELQNDPSSDNYKYFRSTEFNTASDSGTGILNRYLNFTNVEGNTPIDATQNGYSTSGTPTPDNEDLNTNGTLDTQEEYWEYKIKLTKNDLVRGKNYVVDEILDTVLLANGREEIVKWYQFRVPLNSGVSIGGIQNFKSIDFIRMYMTGFPRPVVLRFARIQLISTSWRKYLNELAEDDEVIPVDPNPATTIELGTVNIEDNGGRTPFNYMMPPNIERQRLQNNIQQQGVLMNEQSLVMKVCNLADGDAKGAYRVLNYDLRSYKHLKMWVHAEPADASNPAISNFVNDGDLKAFIRLGSDNSNNFYEYEIPLSPSRFDGTNSANDDEIWKAQNEFDIDLEVFNVAKAIRNEFVDSAGDPNLGLIRYRYTTNLPDGHAIYVTGTPKLSEIKSVMIGVRNPKADNNGPVCAEVWFNELRLSDFNERPGYAVTGRLNLKLADFANLTFSGMARTPGFGSIEQRINTRTRETLLSYDFGGNFSMGKFFPAKWGIELPVYVAYGEKFINPEFNPQEADVKTVKYLENIEDLNLREKRRNDIQDYTRNRSFSLNNVRKTRTAGAGGPPTAPGGPKPKEKKPKPYDIENFAASFSVSEIFHRDFQIERNIILTHKVGLMYNFQNNPKNYQPFKGGGKHKNPITEFNFYLLPKAFSVNLSGDRRFETNKFRPSPGLGSVDSTFFRNFTIGRTYNFRHDFTRSLGLTFTAANQGRVDEPLRAINDMNRDSIWTNLLSFTPQQSPEGYVASDSSRAYFLPGKDKLINLGRNINYNHSIGLTYTLPFDKFPWTNFLGGNLSYQGNMNWTAAPDNNPSLGNNLGNGNTIQANGRLQLNNLYTKIPFIKKILNESKGPAKVAPKQGSDLKVDPKEKQQVKPAAPDAKEEDSTFHFLKVIGKEFIRIVTSVQNVDLTYSTNNATSLPGYMPNTDNFGLDFKHYYELDSGVYKKSTVLPPTLPFIFGLPLDTTSLAFHGKENGWLSRDPALTRPYTVNKGRTLSGRTSITLFRELKIDLTANQDVRENFSSILRWDTASLDDHFVFDNKLNTGSYSTSYIFIPSALERVKEDGVSKAFTAFDNARFDISRRQAEKVGSDSKPQLGGYYYGFNKNHQDVLIPAFLSAYTGRSVNKIGLSAFPAIPLPNWSVNFNGLSKIAFFKKFANTITIKHAYRGTYTVGNYLSNIRYVENESGFTDSTVFVDVINGDSVVNYQTSNNISDVSIMEQFAPLIGVSVNFKNGLTGSFDFKQSRNLTFRVGNIQLTESTSKDYSITLGWRKDKMNKTISLFGKELQLKNSLNAQFNLTLSDRKQRNRTLEPNQPQGLTGGNRNILIGPKIDYTVNSRLNVMFYIDMNINKPHISTSFPTRFTQLGFKIRFTL